MNGLVTCLSHADVCIQQMTLEAIALLTVDIGAREQVNIHVIMCIIQVHVHVHNSTWTFCLINTIMCTHLRM